MGNPVSKALEKSKTAATGAHKEVERDLQDLVEILRAKEEQLYEELISLNGDDTKIPIKQIVAEKKHASVKVSTQPSKELTDAIDDMFGKNVLPSLKALALGAG